jgi:hypothetical protein
MIKISRARTQILESAAESEQSRSRFVREHHLRIPGILDDDLLRQIRQEMATAVWNQRVHKNLNPPAVDLRMEPNAAHSLLGLVLNDPVLLTWIRQITGAEQVSSFLGNVYRIEPGLDHYCAWHNDLVEDRVTALTINLSSEPYSGGMLQIKNLDSGEIRDVPNTGFGDAILIQIAPHLKHRVSELSGSAPKTAYAGHFYRQPDYLTLLQQASEDAHSTAD